MPTIEAKSTSGEPTEVTLEIVNSEVLLSATPSRSVGESMAVVLGASELDQLMTVVRDMRKALRRERKGKDRSSGLAAPNP